MEHSVQSVIDQILKGRNYGLTTCVVSSRKHRQSSEAVAVKAELDEFIAQLGFNGLNDQWSEIAVTAAQFIAMEVLRRDLPIGVHFLPEQEATRLAERFLSFFDSDVRCFTNGNLIIGNADASAPPGCFSPISASPSDTGIICVDNQRIGILWVDDED